MTLSYNALFAKRSEKNSIKSRKHNCSLSTDLLNKDISVIDDCYYFDELAPIAKKHSSDLVDRTGNECFYNKVFINDFLGVSEQRKFLQCGIEFAQKLAQKLEATFKKGFNVILSADEVHCYVTFHKVRDGEEWLSTDLEEYKSDAVLKISI